MSLVMKVSGDRWREHLRSTAEQLPGLIPVAKGNGYGFGVGRLARRAEWLGLPTLAVGTYDELDQAMSRYPGDIVVLTPWRSFLPAAVQALENPRIIHTAGRLADLAHLKGRRLVLEVATSMRRHGFAPTDIPDALKVPGLRIEALSIHLPLPGPQNVTELARILQTVAPSAKAAGVRDVWVSHLSAEQLNRFSVVDTQGLTLRPRVGTQLWLGAPSAIRVESSVLDAHPITKGETFGYWQRPAPTTGTIVIVSGGTGHGIGLEAPVGSLTTRDRAARIARGGLDALGRVKSPFVIGPWEGQHHAMFAEPPHMQSSMLLVPRGQACPEPGDVLRARVRHTATWFDRVEFD